MGFVGYQDTGFSTLGGYSTPLVPIVGVTEKESRLLRNASPAVVEYVGELKNMAAQADAARELEKRRAMAKGQEALETVGTAGALGFVRGYYPDWKPLGFNPSLVAGVAMHGAAMYVADDAHRKHDAELLKYETSLEHMGNGALSAFAFEEMREVAGRLKAQKAAAGAAKATTTV